MQYKPNVFLKSKNSAVAFSNNFKIEKTLLKALTKMPSSEEYSKILLSYIH